ncbi:AtpZ/AtpI family protein [Diplocloster hominis]|uniref:AtpZ/AtpI family protein n=1 Tax=Diplocloster hominis TaxID=3079010 RepID=UPI0031BB2C4B
MKKSKRSVWKAFAMITQFTINMLVPIFLCGFLGIWIHRTFGIPAEIPLFFLGALAGFRNVYIMAKSVYDDDKGAKKK